MWKYTLVLTALLAVTPAVQAGPLKFYVGGSLGGGLNLDGGDLGLDLPDFGIDRDNQTWKVFGGIGIGRILGVEAAYHDFGTVVCCEGVADSGFRLDVEGVSVAGLAGIPIGRLRLFAKAGLLSWKADGRLLTFAGSVPLSLDGEDPMGGVGADLKVNEHWFVRAELELFRIDEGTLDIGSVGVQYKF